MVEETLFNVNDLDPEYQAYQALLPFLQQTIEDNYAPPEALHYEKNADNSSVWFSKTLLFRIRIGKKSSYISFSTKKPELFSRMSLYQTKTDIASNFYRCNIEKPDDICKYADSLSMILEQAIYNQPKECDICDLYLKCSDAKRCVHWKREFSLHCGYKKILKSGRIFYGANRNVD